MALHDHHDVGVLLTPDVVGKTLYSHSAACKGKLVRLFVSEVGYTHTEYHTEEGDSGSFCTGNQGKGGKNWQAINLQTASEEIGSYWKDLIKQKYQELAELRVASTSVQEQILRASLADSGYQPHDMLLPEEVECPFVEGEWIVYANAKQKATPEEIALWNLCQAQKAGQHINLQEYPRVEKSDDYVDEHTLIRADGTFRRATQGEIKFYQRYQARTKKPRR